MVHTQVISKAASQSRNKPLRSLRNKIRKKRDKRLFATARLAMQEIAPTDPYADVLQRESPRAKVHGTQRHFDDIVMQAESADAVFKAFDNLAPGTNMTCEIARAIEARYKRLEVDMGFATSGMRRMVCLGALCMSVVGIGLAVSGLHLGALSFACGAGVLATFIILALLTYCYRCVAYRHTVRGRAALARHREVLKALRTLCNRQNIMPDAPCRVLLDRSVSITNGNVGFVALEVMRGTILEPLVTASGMARRKLKAWNIRRGIRSLGAI